MRSALYRIVSSNEHSITLQDCGDHRHNLTITNDAEGVIQRLAEGGHLAGGRRVLYHNSMGLLSELLHDGERFAGFECDP